MTEAATQDAHGPGAFDPLAPSGGEPAPLPLLEPRDGVPRPVDTAEQLAYWAGAFATGEGPVAVDAERASGYRFSSRAYLVQVRRKGAGTALFDPIPLPGLGDLAASIVDAEWVLHAASQDLPCLALEGMRPQRIFDTELAGRLLGYPRVGLATMVGEVLGYALEKGHSAADWSTRPLPEPWLRYAALDVEVLLELRDALEVQLRDAGKLGWAAEEFAAVLSAGPPPTRAEPWRRTSGLHRVRRPRQLAAVRGLWDLRNALAQEHDRAPGRILPDAAIVNAALSAPRTAAELTALPGFRGRNARRHAGRWMAALTTAEKLSDTDLPAQSATSEGPPPARSWADRDPAAARRLGAARVALTALADEHGLPSENLLAPDAVRRLAWEPPEPLEEAQVEAFLRAHGARNWQLGLTVPALTGALQTAG